MAPNNVIWATIFNSTKNMTTNVEFEMLNLINALWHPLIFIITRAFSNIATLGLV